MGEHGKSLEPKITKLQESMGRLASEDRAAQLLSFVRRPGWTTPQEAQLVHAMLDALMHQVEGIETAHRALMVAAEQIGQH